MAQILEKFTFGDQRAYYKKVSEMSRTDRWKETEKVLSRLSLIIIGLTINTFWLSNLWVASALIFGLLCCCGKTSNLIELEYHISIAEHARLNGGAAVPNDPGPPAPTPTQYRDQPCEDPKSQHKLTAGYIYPSSPEVGVAYQLLSKPIHTIRDEDDLKCSVCWEEYHWGDALTQTPCGHLFHDTCARRAMNKSFKCPLCQSEFEWKVGLKE